jgi:hypothetical protein
MTRAKSKPPVHKPVFDTEGILRFAALEENPAGHDARPAGMDPDRLHLTLLLKPEVMNRLKAEAARKEKTIDQIVEKLVTKHLGKH